MGFFLRACRTELVLFTSSDSSVPGLHTCTFLYRKPAGQSRLQTPDYYYCRSDSMPHSAITTMLKYFANLKRP
jgi:hypothetical protein